MPLLLLFGLPVLEIYVFIQVVERFGFVNSCFAVLLSMVVGVGIAKSQGKFMFRHLQQSMAARQVPEARIVHSLLIFIGGVLMVIPGFLTTLAGLVFVLPGTRHILAFWLKARLLAQIGLGKLGIFSAGGVRAFRFGMGGFSGSAAPSDFGAPGDSVGPIGYVRDVTPQVIDVTPISRSPRQDPNRDDGD